MRSFNSHVSVETGIAASLILYLFLDFLLAFNEAQSISFLSSCSNLIIGCFSQVVFDVFSEWLIKESWLLTDNSE